MEYGIINHLSDAISLLSISWDNWWLEEDVNQFIISLAVAASHTNLPFPTLHCTVMHHPTNVLNTVLHNSCTILKQLFCTEQRCNTLKCCALCRAPSRFPFAVKGRSVKKKPNVPATSQLSGRSGLARHGISWQGLWDWQAIGKDGYGH